MWQVAFETGDFQKQFSFMAQGVPIQKGKIIALYMPKSLGPYQMCTYHIQVVPVGKYINESHSWVSHMWDLSPHVHCKISPTLTVANKNATCLWMQTTNKFALLY